MDINPQQAMEFSRRRLLGGAAYGVGAMALGSLLHDAAPKPVGSAHPGLRSAALPGGGRAKRVISLFMSEGPGQMDLFDYHPEMRKLHGTELPDSVRGGQRITGMTSGQTAFPVVAPMFAFEKVGPQQTWMSEILPHIKSVAGEITVIKSLWTEAINHDPAITYMQTGFQQPGKASMGSWLSYGIGSESKDLPSYIVMVSKGRGRSDPQPLFARLWGSGFLPAQHQGVQLRTGREPVLFLEDAAGIDRGTRRSMLDTLAGLNSVQLGATGDQGIAARIAQYEMAFRMQASVPELVDLADEPESVYELYGEDARKPGTFARHCLLARRLAERGVRFVQLFHRGWDQHFDLPRGHRLQAEEVDQASAALIKDLKQRGMLDDTLVTWGGEFGRTIYSQGKLSNDNHGRDHHGRCFSMFMVGGGIKAGFEYGRTDDYSWNIVENPVHIRDLHATMLHCMGIDHAKLTYPFMGLDQRLTGTETARVVSEILA